MARTRACLLIACLAAAAAAAQAQALPPELTQPVNDFARIIDPEPTQAIDSLIRRLLSATGDVIVVATVQTVAPYADTKEYAVKMFENRGRGIGQPGQDNGILVLVAVKERRVEIEVGYALEEFITDGFSGETSRDVIAPHFRRGDFGAGLLAGVSAIAERIANRRNVSLDGAAEPRQRDDDDDGGPGSLVLIGLAVFFLIIRALGGGRRRRGWGGLGGWHSGVGPFGGGFGGGRFGGGGFGGGGFGGGFGGFGGGRSGGGGGGSSW